MALKAFITGASGFAGQHLIKHLQAGDCLVCGTSFPEPPSHLEGFSGGEYFHLDIRSVQEVNEALKETRPDWVFHLAAISNVGQSWKKRRETLETNLMGSFNLLEAVREFVPGARFLYVSSSDIYGMLPPSEEALREDHAPLIVSPYAFTKVSGELLCDFYARIENLDIVIARPFPHTGPGQRPDFVCSDWAAQIARIENAQQEPVIRVGNLDIRRDFTDVRDMVRAYVLLLEKGKKGEVYNICSGQALALREILGTLLSFSPTRIEVRVDPDKFRKADIRLLAGDNQKIKKDTAWEPKISLRQSLQDLLEYWRSSLP